MPEWVAKNEHIKHVYANADAHLSKTLVALFKITLEESQFLIHLGAVYVDKKRVREDILVKTGQYLRVHLYPRRWPVEKVDWKSTIFDETPDFFIVNKPSGIPVPSSVDNFLENACYQIEKCFGIPVYVTHRLDRPTCGLFVLAKTKEFQSKFNRLLLNRAISKKYLALSKKEVPVGLVTHYMEDSLTAPKKISSDLQAGWLKCEMVVLSSTKRTHFGEDCFENEIELLTGRTHQIRAQMSLLGAPLLGDIAYGGEILGAFNQEAIGLMAQKLAFLDKSYALPPFKLG